MATEDLIAKAVGRIPPQLRREEFRFVPILRGDKRPFEGNWNKPGGNNYSFNDPKLALVSRLQEIIDSDSRAVLNHKNRIVAARHATAATTRLCPTRRDTTGPDCLDLTKHDKTRHDSTALTRRDST